MQRKINVPLKEERVNPALKAKLTKYRSARSFIQNLP